MWYSITLLKVIIAAPPNVFGGLITRFTTFSNRTALATQISVAPGTLSMPITRSFGGSQWLAFRTVVLPSTLPFIISGIRIGAGRALVGVVSAEILSANVGLGFYIALKAQFLDVARAMFGIIIFGFLGLVIGEGVRAIERRFEVWRPDLHH